MLPVEIVNVALLNKRFVIFLKGTTDKRALPIFIDDQQAQSIIIQINKVEVPRPLTHDLFKSVLDSLGAEILRIEVSDLIDDTFYARLIIDFKGTILDFDARPSDAICLALRFGAPMYVAEKVMDKAGIIITEEGGEPELPPAEPEAPEKPQLKLSPLDALKQKLEKAVEEERYEDAAKLRDELKKMTSSN
ncbi:MAG TPA: bifunctional nuclease family protein [Chitinivibrionales bacterium]|nr:bifunctional nuclease family protein [Chitinivibrionales bacterium]